MPSISVDSASETLMAVSRLSFDKGLIDIDYFLIWKVSRLSFDKGLIDVNTAQLVVYSSDTIGRILLKKLKLPGEHAVISTPALTLPVASTSAETWGESTLPMMSNYMKLPSNFFDQLNTRRSISNPNPSNFFDQLNTRRSIRGMRSSISYF